MLFQAGWWNVGLGLNNNESFVYILKEHNFIEEAVFSVYLGYDQDYEITFGGYNQDISQIHYHKLFDKNFWRISGN